MGNHEHQVFINRLKTLDSKYKDAQTFVSYDPELATQTGHLNQTEKTKILQQTLQQKLKSKKSEKCKFHFSKNTQKKYKKRLLMKKYTEDYEADGDDFIQYETTLAKYKKKRLAQFEKDNKLIDMQNQPGDEPLHQVLKDIRDEFFSDLNPEDIPNSEVSDISDSEVTGVGNQMIDQIEQA